MRSSSATGSEGGEGGVGVDLPPVAVNERDNSVVGIHVGPHESPEGNATRQAVHPIGQVQGVRYVPAVWGTEAEEVKAAGLGSVPQRRESDAGQTKLGQPDARSAA